jgi:hypothetical protein
MFRSVRRGTTKFLRTAEGLARLFGRMPWKLEKFSRLIEPEIVAAQRAIGHAEVIVGIPFHRETDTIAQLVETVRRDLETLSLPAAIVIVTERRTRSLLPNSFAAASENQVTVAAFGKPFGFGQKPGLTRRSWSHWAILQLAGRLNADVVFIDADVRNAAGWILRYLDAIRHRSAIIAVADYVRKFATDDALVHIWDSLIFGAVFKNWIGFRHGGDYAIARSFIPELLKHPGILRERAYTMDSAVMRLAAEKGARIEHVWLGEKIHSPITPASLFNRLPILVESVFDDVAAHLPLLVKLHRRGAVVQQPRQPAARVSTPMRDLIGDEFRFALAQDQSIRFRNVEPGIRRMLGRLVFSRFANASTSPPEFVAISAQEWAKATIRFLRRYLRLRDQSHKSALARAYVPILQLGILSFLNRTYSLTYTEASQLIEEEYLPVFQAAWSVLARRRMQFPQFPLLRGWPIGIRSKVNIVVRRFSRSFPLF